MGDDSDDEEPPRRAGRARAHPARYRAERDLDCGPTGRPTAGERRKANDLIDAMLHLKMLRGKAACVTTNLIALAVAWSENRISFDACAASDNNRLFGLPPRCETHRDWVDDVQRRIAQAQEYLALDTHDRLNFRPTLWTAAELAEHRTQGVPALSLFQPAFPSSTATSSIGRTSRPYYYKPALAMDDTGLRALAVVVERAASA